MVSDRHSPTPVWPLIRRWFTAPGWGRPATCSRPISGRHSRRLSNSPVRPGRLQARERGTLTVHGWKAHANDLVSNVDLAMA